MISIWFQQTFLNKSTNLKQAAACSHLLGIAIEKYIAVILWQDQELYVSIWPCAYSQGLYYPQEERQLAEDGRHIRHLNKQFDK